MGYGYGYGFSGGSCGGYGGRGRPGYSYSAITPSGSSEPDSRHSRGQTRSNTSRRTSDSCDRHAPQQRHRADTGGTTYESLPSGLTAPRDIIPCNLPCSNDRREECHVRFPSTFQNLGPQHYSQGPSKTASNAPSNVHFAPTGKKAPPRVSTDRPPVERKQYHRQSHESIRSVRSKVPPRPQVSRPSSIAPAQRSVPARSESKSKGGRGLWGCFGG
ncbi:hypothetical protein BKA56DRAFT_90687 [Ilyonectria sp. MPI-CAGE-AT-0026]|nr:hypothetical protein BKA56DRAFT_90687 [Ilyonectria sp. MPI-CAGE-AT-0026]